MNQESFLFLLLQIFLCLFCLQFATPVFEKLKAPKVFAEIFSGLVLGPTIFKNIFPGFYSAVFVENADALKVFSGIQELGLLLLMFCSGLEVEMLVKGKEKNVTFITGILGVLFPFALSYGASDYFYLNDLLGPKGNSEQLKYFFAVACSITSIPVISRIFIDLNMLKTKFATISLSVALIEDLILYAIMALFISIGTTKNSLTFLHWVNIEKDTSLEAVLHILLTAAMISACFKLIPRLILRFKKFESVKKIFGNYLTLSFMILLCVTIVSTFLGIPSFLGPFLAGIIIGRTPLQNSEHVEHIKSFSFSTFIPIFFIGIGLKLDLFHAFDFKFFLLFLVFSSFVKILGVTFSFFLSRNNLKHSLNFGIALNARGGPGIVLASVGLAAQIINESYFVTLILTALITSWFTGWWLNVKRNEIESYKF